MCRELLELQKGCDVYAGTPVEKVVASGKRVFILDEDLAPLCDDFVVENDEIIFDIDDLYP